MKRELEPKCVPQLFLESCLGTRRSTTDLLCDKRDIATTCEFCRDVILKESEVCRIVISFKIIVTLDTQGLQSSFLSCPVA